MITETIIIIILILGIAYLFRNDEPKDLYF